MKKSSLIASVVHALTFNRPLSLIILFSIVAFGSLAYLATPKQYNPEILRPAFSIVTPYPGAHVDEVDTFVTRELVELVRDIPHVDEVTGRSEDGGRSVVSVVFDVGTDTETAKVALYTRIMQSIPRAQGAMGEPVIHTITPDDVPIVTIALYSDTLGQNDVRAHAISLMHTLQQIDGVANLTVHGGASRALLVHIDPEALRERNLTTTHVADALQQSTYAPRAGALADTNQVITLAVDDDIDSAAAARAISVAPGVLLGDVTTIQDAWEEMSSYVRFTTPETIPHDAVYVAIAKRPGENAPAVASDIRDTLAQIMQGEDFAQISSVIVRDDGAIAEKEIQGLGINLMVSIIIVGGVLMLFLSYRPAAVVITAIPLTLLLVFFVAFLSGETINRITLFALILSLGLLVDSATVVVENIHRHIVSAPSEETRDTAVIRAVDQVSTGLILSAATSVVVFLPVRFITGMMGPYMGPLSFFVPMAIIMSLVVAFLVTPFLAHSLLRTNNTGKKQDASLLAPLFEKLTAYYTRLLRTLLYTPQYKRRVLQMSAVALGAALLLPTLGLVHFQMLPKADKEQFYVYLDMPDGTDTPATQSAASHIEKILLEQETVISIQSFTGSAPVVDFNGMFKGVQYRTEPHHATLRVNLSDPDARRERSSDIVTNIRSELQNLTLPVGATVRVLEDPPGPPVMATFVGKVFGAETEVRERLARTIAQTLKETKGAVHIETSIEEPAPQLTITVDEALARAHGVHASDVERAVALLLGPQSIAQYHLKNAEEYAPIIVSLPRDERATPIALERIDVRTIDGGHVPLSSVATYQWMRTIPTHETEQLEPVTYVTAETDNRSIVYVMIDVITTLHNYRDTEGSITSWSLFGMTYTTNTGDTYSIAWGGEWEMTLENFRDLGIAMIVALFLVYAILVAQYRSFRTPALVMMTVPFGLVGILPGFFLLDAAFDIYLTATALIGFIALIGIVVNNAIIYLEYVDELRNERPEADEREILIEAGAMRLRPILLTSLTTVLGSITIASDPVWSGLAWSIVFGLSLSTALTLILFPLLYSNK